MVNLDYKVEKHRTSPKVLLVNDDGPPSKHSPHVLGLYMKLKQIGWDVTVVLPSYQKSWGSMQFSLAGPVHYWYYYPLANNNEGSHPDTQNSWSPTRREINHEKGEITEWILIDGSPTTASNAGLFNQDAFFGSQSETVGTVPASSKTPFDLVISGPNFGRNTGTAFALSSGTLGAALAASLSGVRSIALSYGHFMTHPPTLQHRAESKDPGLTPTRLIEVADLANSLSVALIQKLWANWDSENDVGCYSVNIPLAETLTEPQAVWTRIWENRYGPLFAIRHPFQSDAHSDGGLDGKNKDSTKRLYPNPPAPQPAAAPPPVNSLRFAPQMASLLRPKDLTPATDVWAVQNGYISITRLRPNFMEVDRDGNGLDVARIQRLAAEQSEADNVSLQEGLEVGMRWRL